MNYPERILQSGKTIYDRIRENEDLFLPVEALEAALRRGLRGLNLDYPLRTRSKVLKSRVCEILGYPVPRVFRKTRPRFPGQDFDTYIQKSNNLQIWNEEIIPTRRYVVVRVDDRSVVTAVRVVTGEYLARLDTTGTLTRKFQAKSKIAVTASELLTKSDTYGLVERVRALGPRIVGGIRIDFGAFLRIADLYGHLVKLTGTSVCDPGSDQERVRGGALHEAVCLSLGMAGIHDTGTCPDVLGQLLEIKLQTSPTIDLGFVSPDDPTPLETIAFARHSDIRYAVFYGEKDGSRICLRHLVMCSGRDFFGRFQRFEGKILNAKLQIPLPANFFG